MPRIFGHYVAKEALALTATDGVVVLGSVFAGLALPMFGVQAVPPAWEEATPAAVVLSLLVVGTAYVIGLYDTRQVHGRPEVFLRLVTAFGIAYAMTAALGYLLPPVALGRKAFVLSLGSSLPVAFAFRLIHHRLTANTRLRQKVLLLGGGRPSDLIARTMALGHHGYDLIGYLDSGNGGGTATPELWRLGSVEDLKWIAKVTKPDVIVVALEERRGTLPVSDIVECKLRGIEVEDWPTFYEKLTGKIPLDDLRPSWLVFADGFKPARLTRVVKRGVDLLASLAGCLITLPLMLVIAAAIKLDSPGPALFRQERTGQFGRIFSVFKFRSMRQGAHLVPAPRPGAPDPRVTRVGRLLRRTRLDELPQLINVVLGDMSLVGPRPEWIALVPAFKDTVPFYLHRLAAKPGITGWAQVNNPYGASVENTHEKLQYDLYYIKNRSIFLDLLILLQTIQIVLFTRGSDQWTSRTRPGSTTSVSYAEPSSSAGAS